MPGRTKSGSNLIHFISKDGTTKKLSGTKSALDFFSDACTTNADICLHFAIMLFCGEGGRICLNYIFISKLFSSKAVASFPNSRDSKNTEMNISVVRNCNCLGKLN